MLRARAPRRLPGAFRRGLTFWRRSIQARVVASTVILSAVVIAGVGWLLLQQTRDGLLDQRVDAVTGEVADEIQAANGRLASAPGQDADPS
ncbi:MAG TPA: two-component sensor histidine kinase, partial [Nocardioides sp.]|nr:two-component sensor histidine kinase [Nocardioides sp.]